MMSWSEPRRRTRASDAVIALSGLAFAMLASLASLGCDHPPAATRPPTSTRPPPLASVSPAPMPVLASAPAPSLRITEGAPSVSADRAIIREPATRGYLVGSTGDRATLAFTYRGRSHSVAAMASGDERAQLGLKLRAQDSCNVIYVMWRIEPTSEIVVQVKRNDSHTHDECGNDGYARVRPSFRAKPPALGVPEAFGTTLDHELRASIVDDQLEVIADDKVVWRGTLPDSARDLRGPAGFRTDNVDIDLSVAQ